jgi:hypothetical protein
VRARTASLELLEVQPPGGRVMSYADYGRGTVAEADRDLAERAGAPGAAAAAAHFGGPLTVDRKNTPATSSRWPTAPRRRGRGPDRS